MLLGVATIGSSIGLMGRLLVSERCGTLAADREREAFFATYGAACTSTFFYHYARLIEILYASERIETL